MRVFETINKAYNSVFKPGQLSIGVVIPIENYVVGAVPTMQDHVERVKLVELLGFTAIWVRDVPYHVPSFGDVGQMYDPFTYLGYLAGHTSEIGLAIGSIALPLHHPLHVAKSAATIDQLSGGRLLMGVASGDRPQEYPVMGIDFHNRDELFRDSFAYIRAAAENFPVLDNNHYGKLDGQVDALPKPTGYKLPMLITGHSRQSLDWIAEYGDAWMYYPRNFYMQQNNIAEWRAKVAEKSIYDKPFMQSLYLDLQDDDDHKPTPIHLGFKIGANHLREYLENLRQMGVNHVGINLRLNTNDTVKTLEALAEKILPHFHISNKQEI